MPNLLAPAPVPVRISGRDCKLSFSMHAVVLYQRETARIERARFDPEADPDADPRCNCGARKSEHVGAGLIRVNDDAAKGPKLLCVKFRAEDPLLGDSLFVIDNWLKIDLNVDPERWLVCLWCGMHERVGKAWKAPFTLDELSEALGLCGDTRGIGDKMGEAMNAWMPHSRPNATAPGEPAPANSETSSLPILESSLPAPVSATDSAPTSSLPVLPAS